MQLSDHRCVCLHLSSDTETHASHALAFCNIHCLYDGVKCFKSVCDVMRSDSRGLPWIWRGVLFAASLMEPSNRARVSVLDAAEMENTKEPCRTCKRAHGSSLVFFCLRCTQLSGFTTIAVVFLCFFSPQFDWIWQNNLLITFRSHAQYGAAVDWQQSGWYEGWSVPWRRKRRSSTSCYQKKSKHAFIYEYIFNKDDYSVLSQYKSIIRVKKDTPNIKYSKSTFTYKHIVEIVLIKSDRLKC